MKTCMKSQPTLDFVILYFSFLNFVVIYLINEISLQNQGKIFITKLNKQTKTYVKLFKERSKTKKVNTLV